MNLYDYMIYLRSKNPSPVDDTNIETAGEVVLYGDHKYMLRANIMLAYCMKY